MAKNIETKKFGAEIGKVLNLMIKSLYANNDTPFREGISNGADACEKMRYQATTNSSLYEGDTELHIAIKADKKKGTLTITDNGIGMNYNDLIENLGTIANSGTQRFLEQMTGDSKKDNQLIGQFGVGFYSFYMIADKVEVISRKAGEAQSYIWESKGDGEYTIAENSENSPRGTQITLHLKESEHEFLDSFRIKHIIKTYSDHIAFPIHLIDFDENDVEKKEQINSSKAIWTRAKTDITPEEYKEFYKSVGQAYDDPWLILHNRNEGMIEFTNLLFIPSQKPFDLFHPDRRPRVKLYIKKVFIAEENIDLIPQYLRFVRGIVDSSDLPLNISRETLQSNINLAKIKNAIKNIVLNELKNKLENNRAEYEQFWQNFGPVVKEGLCEGLPEPEKLLDLSLFKSALSDKLISLNEYIEKMQANQKTIYYLSGDDSNKLKNSPQIEGFLSRNIDVLLFTDHVDDFWSNVIHKYKDFEIKSATRANIDLDETKNADSKEEENKKDVTDSSHDSLINFFKDALSEKVKAVKISKKLTSSPVCLAVDEGSMDIRMERFLKEQKQLNSISAKILEINIDHPIIKKIADDVNSNIESKLILNKELISLLFDQACILEGEPINDVSSFCKKLNDIIVEVANK